MSKRYVDWYANGSRSQLWRTPRALFDAWHAEYEFTMDGAASDAESALLPRFSSQQYPLHWDDERVFCNPPWSSIAPFVECAPSAAVACLLVPARTNCKWFHRALELGAAPRFFRPKPKFVGAPHVSPVDCLLLIFDRAQNEH